MRAVFGCLAALNSLFGACEISLRDQALLMTKSRTLPFPGHLTLREITGAKAECVSIGRLVVLHFPGEGFLALLNKERTFTRWDYTSDYPNGPLEVTFGHCAGTLNPIDSRLRLRMYGSPEGYSEELRARGSIQDPLRIRTVHAPVARTISEGKGHDRAA